MEYIYKILLFLEIILSVLAQLSLKYGMQRANIAHLGRKDLFAILNKMFLNLFVIFGFIFYGIALLLWVVVLSELDLSYAYPVISLSYVLVALGSQRIFGEVVSRKRWLAIFIIVAGVVLVGLS